MRWGRKKPSQNSSSRQSFMSHVLPTSWLSKFKHMNINNNSNKQQAQETPKGKCNSSVYAATATPTSSTVSGGVRGRFHGSDGDAFWRLSFGEDSFDERTKIARRVPHGFDNESELSIPNCQSCRLNFERVADLGNDDQELRNMVSDTRKKEIRGEINDDVSQEKVVEIRTPRLKRTERDKLVKFNEESRNSMEREDCKLPAYDSYMNSIDSAEKPIPDWKKLKEMKIEELKLRNDQQRKSLYISRDSNKRRKPKQSVKLRVYSPRTAAKLEICRVKALEDMKRAKLRMKKAKEKAMEEPSNGFDSFAVVKCSFNPQNDFKESMIEMIKEKDIRRPEELEELLACYLTLNADEYHDLIIKVFRQVWFELNKPCPCIDGEPETESCLPCKYVGPENI